LLIGSTAIAVLLANSPWSGQYFEALRVKLGIELGGLALEKPVLLWINDGLMGLFFFHVGLEIKREVMQGELSTVRKAALPALAAIGGMLVPAFIYAAINWNKPGEGGWGIPMATDIAFALGVLALLGDRVPTGLKVFLTALAIVDDIGAVLVIAVFYTDAVSLVSLGLGAAFYLTAIGLNRLRVVSAMAYFVLGTLVWVAFLKSGVHATIAALLMAFTIPSGTRIDGHALLRRIDRCVVALQSDVGVPSGHGMNTSAQEEVLSEMVLAIDRAGSPLLRLEHALVPLVSFVVLPVFALANAGVVLDAKSADALLDPVSVGIVAGLFFGKQIGVTLFTWLAVRLGVADLPGGVTFSGVYGVGAIAGVGFTMSLFVSGLALDSQTAETAKVGILVGSVASGLLGWFVLNRSLARSEA
jgi:NhaA family Na+:H+ antiporter